MNRSPVRPPAGERVGGHAGHGYRPLTREVRSILTIRASLRHVESLQQWRSPLSDNPSVIVAGARTPIGRLLGGLKDLSAADLGGVAIKGALEKAGVAADQVDYVIMGQVILAGAGQNPARNAAVAGGSR